MLDEIESLLSKIAPKGLRPEDNGDVVALVAAATMIYNRHEVEVAESMKWVSNGNGKRILVPDAVPTADEAEMGERNIREMIEAKKAPNAAFWDPNSTIAALGEPVETRAEWEKIKKERGWVESSPGKDVGGDVRGRGIDKKAIAETAMSEAEQDIAQGRPANKAVTVQPLISKDAMKSTKAKTDEAAEEFGIEDGGVTSAPVTRGGESAFSSDDLIADAKSRILARSR